MKRRNKKPSIKKALGQCKWLLLFAFTTSVAIGARTGNGLDPLTGEAQAQEVLESNTASLPELSPTQTPTPSPTTIVAHPTSTPEPAVEAVDQTSGAGELEEIHNYIKTKFGSDGDNMIRIIGECENKTFDQSRTNHNRNGSIDYGIAQVNSIHIARCGSDIKHDWKANIDCAYSIYERAGNSFRPWTCAYVVGQKNYLNQ